MNDSIIVTHPLSIFVSNKPGVLLRIAIIFARRSVNIESLVVSSVLDGQFSRMTVTANGNQSSINQIIKQIRKLIDVIDVRDNIESNAIARELALVKVAIDADHRQSILQIVEHFKAKTIDLTDSTVVIEISGNSDKIDAFVQLIKRFDIVELTRSGKMVMQRGKKE